MMKIKRIEIYILFSKFKIKIENICKKTIDIDGYVWKTTNILKRFHLVPQHIFQPFCSS